MRNKWLILIPLFFVTSFSLYWRSLDNPFLMDDESQITQNQIVQDISQWPTYFVSSTMGGGGPARLAGIYYKPIMTTFYATIWHFFGADPGAFRIPLIVLHTLNALLIISLFSGFLPFDLATLAGALFLVHPINTEVVIYIANAQDSLYMFFGLLAVWCLANFQAAAWRWPLTFLLLSLSILSKETGALFLFIAPAYAFFFRRKLLWPALITSFFVGSFYTLARVSIGLTVVLDDDLKLHRASYWQRLSTVPSVIWHYFEEYFFKLNSSLTRDYVVTELSFTEFWGPLLGVIALLSAWIYFFLKTRKTPHAAAFGFLSCVLLLWFALHGQAIVPLDGTVSDRWFYLGQVALVGLIALALHQATHKGVASWLRGLGWAGAALALTFCFYRTWNRIGDWAIPLRLYSLELQRFPDDAIMANNVGVELFRDGKVPEARQFFQKSVELNTEWVISANNLGAAEERLGNLDRALQLYGRAVTLGAYSLAYENYASLLCRYLPKNAEERQKQVQACREFLEKRALPSFPNNERLRKTLEESPKF